MLQPLRDPALDIPSPYLGYPGPTAELSRALQIRDPISVSEHTASDHKTAGRQPTSNLMSLITGLRHYSQLQVLLLVIVCKCLMMNHRVCSFRPFVRGTLRSAVIACLVVMHVEFKRQDHTCVHRVPVLGLSLKSGCGISRRTLVRSIADSVMPAVRRREMSDQQLGQCGLHFVHVSGGVTCTRKGQSRG